MTGPANAPPSRSPWTGWRLVSLSTAAAIVMLLIGANAHLVYVAIVSHPGCVPHAEKTGENGAFKAAAPAC